MGCRATSELDHSCNREATQLLCESRREFLTNQYRGLSERLVGQTSSLFIVKACQHRSLHFPEVGCSSPKVGIVSLFLIGCVARKDLMPCGRRVQVLVLDF